MKHQKKNKNNNNKWDHDMYDKIEIENNKRKKKNNMNNKWKHVLFLLMKNFILFRIIQ